MSDVSVEVLKKSVLPLFVPDDGRPDMPSRAGSCVLLDVEGRLFVATALHNFGKLDRQQFFLGPPAARLVPFTVGGIYKAGPEEIDTAVVPLSDEQVEALSGWATPVRDQWIENERPAYSTADYFLIFGYPESRSQFKPDRPRRNIVQKHFDFLTGGGDPRLASDNSIDLDSHLIVEFDPEKVTVGGMLHRPPDPRGISGGVALHRKGNRWILAGIMVRHVKESRIMVAVRAAEVLAIAQHIIDSGHFRR